MRKIFTLLTVLVTLKTIVLCQPSDLFISEHVEGTSNNKALELYNGTGSTIDLTGSAYIIQIYANGGTTPTNNISLSGTIISGTAFVIAHPSAVLGITPNQTSTSLSFNGDDAIILRKGGTSGAILDVIGQVGADPGAEWGAGDVSTADNTIRRKVAMCIGDVNMSDAFDPSFEWNGFATNTFSDLGTHQTTCTNTSGIAITPDSIGFTMSSVQNYTLKGTSLTEDVTVIAPSGFQLSLTWNGSFSTSIVISSASAYVGTLVYLKYTPSGMSPSSGIVTHVSGIHSKSLKVYGSVLQITPIPAIQGSGGISPKAGTVVVTEGVVIANFQDPGKFEGFFIQDSVGDKNPETSDGIFISNTSHYVRTGDFVKLSGTVEESFGKTQIKSISSLVSTDTDKVIQATIISLPVADTLDLEKFEGMLVKFDQALTVTEVYDLGRFGEIALSTNGRLINPTNEVDLNDDPAVGNNSSGNSNLEAVTARQNLNKRSRIILDDNSSIQNPAKVPYIDETNRTLRIGSTMSNLQGILDYAFNNYRLQPTAYPNINYAQRPTVPSLGNADIKIGSFNVLNYFNGDGNGDGFPTPRGASTAEEFTRQRNKIISALTQMNADVIGLMELENDGDGTTSAVGDLVKGLNTATSSDTYAYILDPTGANGNPGTDAIKQAIIYKPGVVRPIGDAIADMDAAHNRPPISQTFETKEGRERFSIVVNHFKSKGCMGATGLDLDLGEGQGCFNDMRKRQSVALLDFIKNIETASTDQDIIVIGDLNAYEQEDPIDLLREGGLVSVVSNTYSYVFMGQSGSLDHVLITPSLSSKVTGAAKWHINADEPRVKDYNTEFNPTDMYSADPYRSSDHDPVLIGLSSAITSTKGSPDQVKITISPNPSSGHIQLAISDEPLGHFSFSVFNMIGEKLQERTLNLPKGKYDMDLSFLDPGIYLIKTESAIGSGFSKIIISK